MNITMRPTGSSVVVGVTGQLDRRTAPELETTLQQLLDAEHPRLVLDLVDVTDMSSAGLRVIISAAKHARRRPGGDLRLASPGKRVFEVLELAGLLPVLRVFDTVQEAVASFEDGDQA